MQREKTPKKVEELSRRCCLLLISLSLPFILGPAPLRETHCIIHDFVNVACRCIFTALYLEKFPRADKTRYRAVRVHARGVSQREALGSCVYCIRDGSRVRMSNRMTYWECDTRRSRKATAIVRDVYVNTNFNSETLIIKVCVCVCVECHKINRFIVPIDFETTIIQYCT